MVTPYLLTIQMMPPVLHGLYAAIIDTIDINAAKFCSMGKTDVMIACYIQMLKRT